LTQLNADSGVSKRALKLEFTDKVWKTLLHALDLVTPSPPPPQPPSPPQTPEPGKQGKQPKQQQSEKQSEKQEKQSEKQEKQEKQPEKQDKQEKHQVDGLPAWDDESRAAWADIQHNSNKKKSSSWEGDWTGYWAGYQEGLKSSWKKSAWKQSSWENSGGCVWQQGDWEEAEEITEEMEAAWKTSYNQQQEKRKKLVHDNFEHALHMARRAKVQGCIPEGISIIAFAASLCRNAMDEDEAFAECSRC
jgi:hypothetical protein